MRENSAHFPKKTLFFLIGVLAVSVISASLYSLFSIQGKVMMNWPIFLMWLGVLLVLNGFLLFFLRRNWNKLGIEGRLASLLWGSVSVWYWIFAVGYDFFNINADALQFKWTTLSYFRDVPLVGIIFISTALFLFRPVKKFLEAKEKPGDGASVYKYTLKYPTYLAIMVFMFSVLGYVLGVVQLRQFAFPPVVEQVKNVLNGIVLSLHLGVFVYLSIDYLMNDVRLGLGQTFDTKSISKRQFSKKFFWVALVATFGSIGLLSLISFKTYQNFINDHLIDEIRLKIENNTEDIKTGDSGKVFELNSGSRLPEDEFSGETLETVSKNKSGSFRDLKNDVKVGVFYTNEATGKKVVSVAYLDEYYTPLSRESLFFFAGLVFIAFFLTIIVALLASLLSWSLKGLKDAVEKSEKGEIFDFRAGSADEVDELADAFSVFIGDSQSLKSDLEGRVVQRTNQLKEKMEQLEKVNQLMVGRELKMAELKKENESLKKTH